MSPIDKLTRARAILARIRTLRQQIASHIWQRSFGFPMPAQNCVHNASLDNELNGWCHNRQQLNTARKCIAILNDARELVIYDRLVTNVVRTLG